MIQLSFYFVQLLFFVCSVRHCDSYREKNNKYFHLLSSRNTKVESINYTKMYFRTYFVTDPVN